MREYLPNLLSSARRAGLHLAPPDARPLREVEAEIDEELAFHLDAAAGDLAASGLDAASARAEAERRFGDLARIRGACRRQKLGERIMLQRIQLVILLLLVLTVGVLAQQWSSASREQQDTIHDLRNHIAELTDAVRGTPVAAATPPEPVEHIVVHVGDTLQVLDAYNPDSITARQEVARDGKVLLPEIGWVMVAGKTRDEVEAELTETYLGYYQQCDVKVRVTSPR